MARKQWVILFFGVLMIFSAVGNGAAGSDTEQLVGFNFRGADIDLVLQFFSAASGLTVVKDPAVTGSITIISPSKVKVSQAIGLLRNALEIRGYTILELPGMLKVLPIEAAKKEGPIRPAEQLTISDGVVTVVIPLHKLKAADVQKQLSPLFGANALIADSQTNTVLITDTAARVMLIRDILSNLEEGLANSTEKDKGAKNIDSTLKVQIKVVPLYYADAATLAKELSQILYAPVSSDTGTNNLVGLVASKTKNNQSLAKLEKAIAANQKTTQDTAAKTPTTAISSIIPNKVVADVRSNSLVITGTPEVVTSIENLVAVLDESLNGESEYITYLISLEHAEPAAVANVLNQINANFSKRGPQLQRVAEDEPKKESEENYYIKLSNQPLWVSPVPDTDSLVITSTRGAVAEITRIVKRLDEEVGRVEQPVVTVYPLQNAKATELANLLNDLFVGAKTTSSASTQKNTGSTSKTNTGTPQTNTQEKTRQNALAAYQQRTGTKIDLNTILDADVRFVPDLPSNSLLIIAPGGLLDQIKEMIRLIDVMPAQVLIEVTVVEVTLDKANQFGLNWSYGTSSSSPGNGTISLGSIPDNAGLSYNYSFGDWQVKLQALAESGSLKVLSNPKILAANNNPAVINIGEQVPYIQSTKETDDNIYKYYSYKNVGIQLKVTPRIGASGNVFLDVEQTVSNLVPGSGVDDVPTIASRDATTSVIVKDGRTLVIGGLIRDNSTETVTKVPVVGEIPLIGNLFKHKASEVTKTELLLFITPRVIRTPEDAEQLTAEMQQKTNPGK